MPSMVRDDVEGHTVPTFPTIKDIAARLNIDESVTPIAQRPRRVPEASKKRVEEILEKLLSQDIIEKVRGASAWVSPLVIALKENGDLRLCVDRRRANLAIRRELHPMPTLDDLLAKLSSA